MSRLIAFLICCVVVMLGLSACVAPDESTEVSSPLSSSPLSAEKQKPASDSDESQEIIISKLGQNEQRAVETAKQALADELKVAADRIDVYATDAAYWQSLWYRPR